MRESSNLLRVGLGDLPDMLTLAVVLVVSVMANAGHIKRIEI